MVFVMGLSRFCVLVTKLKFCRFVTFVCFVHGPETLIVFR